MMAANQAKESFQDQDILVTKAIQKNVYIN